MICLEGRRRRDSCHLTRTTHHLSPLILQNLTGHDTRFFINDGKFWRLSVILTDYNLHPCPVGGECVKLISNWLEILVSSVAAKRGFNFQNKIKMAMRSHLSKRKTQNLMMIASAAITLDAFEYVQVSAQFKSQFKSHEPVGVQATATQFR